MTRFPALFLMLVTFKLSLASCFAQSVRQHVLQNVREIRTLEFSADFEDLQSVGEAVGSARIVMLGEQSHGDGSTFRAKARLVKYLHEQKGFNVLAFESDFYALTSGWSTLSKNPDSIKRFLQYNVYPIWSFSEECKELLYKYLPGMQSTADGICIAGIDPQMHGRYTKEHLASGLRRFFQTYQVALSPKQQELDVCLNFVDTLYQLNTKSRFYIDSLMPTDFKKRLSKFETSAQTIIEQIPQVANSSEYYQALKNLKTFASELLTLDSNASNAARDEQMADNLKWLLSYRYPSDKIIVWAANRHIMKNSSTSFKKASSNTSSMVTSFTADQVLESQTYVLGFTSLTGTSQTVFQKKPFQIREAKGGFESWLPKEMLYGFINFNGKLTDGFRDETFVMKARGHSPVQAKWLNVFDGVFYIKKMAPASTIGK